jgi:hypothetical protein
MKRTLCLTFALFALLSMSLSLVSCGGGGGGSDSSADEPVEVTTYAGGWVDITNPGTETEATNCSPFMLEGEAFISDDHFRCCSGSAEDTAVDVTWQNLSTGDSGKAYQSAETCYLFGTPYLCGHRWWADIPLREGDNLIKVRAQETGGGTGWGTDSITVTKAGASYAVNGSVATKAGSPLSFQETWMDAHIYNNDLAMRGAISSDGAFRFQCIPNGIYTVELKAPLSYVFVPEKYETIVNGGDVGNLDFSTEAYFISGTIVYSTSGTPVKSIAVEVSDGSGILTTFTDVNGQYRVAVPNGNFTVRPYFPLINDPLDFSPTDVQLTVSGADISNINFTFSP